MYTHTHTNTQKLQKNKLKKNKQTPHLVTVKPLPNNMSIRRNTRKLTENSNFPRDGQRSGERQKVRKRRQKG